MRHRRPHQPLRLPSLARPPAGRTSPHLRRLARSPSAFWAGACALAVVTGAAVSHLVTGAQAAAARYGSAREAVFAVRTVAAGDVVGRADVELRRAPAAFLPDDALATLPVGRTAVAPLFPGQAVVRHQLAPDGLRGLAALLPAGRRAVAVPTNGAVPPVRRGDVVDVLATFDPGASTGGEPTFAVARAALVVAVGDDTVTVAVTPEEAARVAFAVAGGTVTLAVAPPGDGTP